MSDIGWNSVEIRKEERPRVTAHELRQMMADLDPGDYDEPVQEFLHELEHGGSPEDLQRAATLLLQDEVDFAPELQAAGVEPDAQLIMLLLAVGADPNAANAYGEPPLHLAARYGYTEIVQMLLQAGANLRLPDSRGKLAADLACSPELAALLTPPQPDYLPPEIEDADAEPGQGCSCGHHHEPGQGCSCGHHHEPGQGCSCGHHHEPDQP
ncbi:MAG: ankyrin repeat domain-containing protein [Akkermansiaceae bacterium]|nr:ankyrin repeat domain-containing protein [Akkermansiaceae bacterium]